MYADVIVDIAHSEVDKIFEYSFESGISKGCRVIVPFGNKVIEGIVMGIKEKSEYPPERIKRIIRAIDDVPVMDEEALSLAEYVCRTCYCTMAQALRQFLPSEMRKGKKKKKNVSVAVLNEHADLVELNLSLKKTAVKQKLCLDYLITNKRALLSELNKTFGQSAVKALFDKNAFNLLEEKVVRSPYKELEASGKSVELTPSQKKAVLSVENTDKTVSLIFGVTGSGKTEVYLKLISDVIKNGKTAIMLVPEIALTPQMLRQLRARFKDSAAILHSGLSAGERFDEWWRIKSGEAKIVIGARSAIFAPLSNIGLIIIDEEHDGSYSSESNPRYNTIDVAKFRANYYGAKIVLGSATPSIESFLRCEEGDYNLCRLPERINKKPLPEVEIVDMKKEVRRGNNTPFSAALKEELDSCLKKGNQAIIFLNQRGYSKTVICTECGHVQKCDSCDVALTYHKDEDALLCHYCGAKYKMITNCTECGSPFLRYGGFGTERVVAELNKLFPQAKILRMDRDTTQSKEGHFKILSAFSERKADILVGTQMIAKGHDFPAVTLVGILDADMSLHFSDYRSFERTFQLLTQVAGRSGRASEAGKVVLQTYDPDNYVLNQAIKYDYENFYKTELSIRKATGFPPFTDIVRVLISSKDEENGLAVTKAIYEELKIVFNENRESFRFFGCMKAPIKKIQDKFRYQVLMRVICDRKDILDEIFYKSNKYNGRNASVFLEVNPNNLS